MDSAIVVSVCTYGRPEGLVRLIESIETTLRESDRILVVDNNPPDQDLLEEVRRRFPSVQIVRELNAGIPAARNRVLDEIRDEWAVIFIDDDEVAEPGWLEHHRAFALANEADVVFGPVISRFARGADPRVVQGGLLDRERHQTGASMPFGPTNNTLVKVRILKQHQHIRFDERYSESGGSDVDFFARLRREGARLTWNDDAVVVEDVPASRATKDWAKRRYQRMGGNMVSLLLDSQSSKTVIAAGALARVLTGALLAPFDALMGRSTRRGAGKVWFGLGMLKGLAGRGMKEYTRGEMS